MLLGGPGILHVGVHVASPQLSVPHVVNRAQGWESGEMSEEDKEARSGVRHSRLERPSSCHVKSCFHTIVGFQKLCGCP